MRGHRYDSKTPELLHNSKTGNKIMVDIEVSDEQTENTEQRRIRKKFYIRAGYGKTPVKYEWRYENYEIFSYGEHISEEEYNGFQRRLTKTGSEKIDAALCIMWISYFIDRCKLFFPE